MILPLSVLLAAAPVSIAVPGVSCVGMSQQLCDSFLDRLVAVMGTSAGNQVKIVTQKDITQVLGLERQRELLGCADSGQQCTAELAGALGVDGILSMSLTRSAPYFVATARITRTKDGSPWATSTERVTREGDLFDVMDGIARAFVTRLTVPVSDSTAVVTQSPGGMPKIVRWVPGIVGVVAIAGGVGVFLAASSERSLLTNHQATGSDIAVAVEGGRTKQQLGVGLMVVGGVAVAASAVWVLLGGSGDKSVAVAPMPGGAAFVLGGALP